MERAARFFDVRRPFGSTYLEVQIALAIFSFGLGGLIPLVVMNSRQLRAVADRLPANQTHYLVPPSNAWSAKLGVPADVADVPPAPNSPSVDLIDDVDVGFSLIDEGTPDWTSHTAGSAYLSGYYKNNGGDAGDTAVWTFSEMKPYKYDVLVTYPEDPSFASNAPYRVFDGATQLATVPINQKTAPTGPSYDGNHWDSLGQFTITSGSLKVELTDDANGFIAADAVRVVALKYKVEVLSVTPVPTSLSVTAEVTVTSP